MEIGNRFDRFLGFIKDHALLVVAVQTVVIVILVVVAGVFAWQYNSLRGNPNALAEETTKRLVTKVSKVYDLPDEKPSVVQISDKEKFKDQPFFASAANGDYLLVYTKAKIAILFREAENKLINVGPISLPDQTGTPAKVAKPVVKLLHGTADKTKADAATAKIKTAVGDSVTVDDAKADAKSRSNKTIVVDVSGKNAELAGKIASSVNGQTGTLPAGEPAPAGIDIVVIVGQ